MIVLVNCVKVDVLDGLHHRLRSVAADAGQLGRVVVHTGGGFLD